MIFVTTGTHYLPFDRLIKMISFIRDETSEDIVIQSGSSKIQVRGTIQQDYFPYNGIIEYLKKARVVISHAGPATVFQSLFMAGKVPIIVPRRKEYGEHVSNHQVFFAEYLEKTGQAVLAESEDRLRHLLLNSTRDFKLPVTLKRTSSLERKLAGYLKTLEEQSRE